MTLGAGVLERALAVMSSFTDDDPALTVRDLADRTGIPASSLHRLVATLVAQRLLVKLDRHRYAPGSRLWELGELAPLALRLRETALPHMLRLYEATGENVHLAVLDGQSPENSTALYVGRLTGRASIPTVSRTGGRHPLHATGVGKALLATRDALWLARFLAGPLEAETTSTITDAAVLRDDIERARARGFAVTRGEMTLGNISVAAALGSVAGLPPAAIGVVAHLDGADERRLAPIVIQTARELTVDLKTSV